MKTIDVGRCGVQGTTTALVRICRDVSLGVFVLSLESMDATCMDRGGAISYGWIVLVLACGVLPLQMWVVARADVFAFEVVYQCCHSPYLHCFESWLLPSGATSHPFDM